MSDPVWAAAVSLALRLRAVIRGDHGETYDLQTGQDRSPAGFDRGHSPHPVWAAAVASASRLGATLRGDKGESCDLQTGQAWDSAAVPRQEMTLVFAPKGIQPNNVIDVVLRLFVKHGIPEHGFELDFAVSDLEISKRPKRRMHPPTQIKGQGFTIEVGNDIGVRSYGGNTSKRKRRYEFPGTSGSLSYSTRPLFLLGWQMPTISSGRMPKIYRSTDPVADPGNICR